MDRGQDHLPAWQHVSKFPMRQLASPGRGLRTWGEFARGETPTLADPQTGATVQTRKSTTARRHRPLLRSDSETPVKLTANLTGLGSAGSQALCLAAHAQYADDAACDHASAVILTIDFD
jgi:hypothetical protein